MPSQISVTFLKQNKYKLLQRIPSINVYNNLQYK